MQMTHRLRSHELDLISSDFAMWKTPQKLFLLVAVASGATLSAEPGQVLSGTDADQHQLRKPPPFGLSFLRVAQPECRRCLKECLGAKIQAAQIAALKIQAPVGLMTWYLFRNRPFKMWPLEDALAQFVSLPPALFAGAAGFAYFSCRDHCDMDCPYPGVDAPDGNELPMLPELDEADASDARFLSQLYRRGSSKGGGGTGSFSSALSDMFRVV
jgi:hypothetical protein